MQKSEQQQTWELHVTGETGQALTRARSQLQDDELMETAQRVHDYYSGEAPANVASTTRVLAEFEPRPHQLKTLFDAVRQAVTLSGSLIRQGLSVQDAAQVLTRALELVAEYYPLAATPQEAQRRADVVQLVSAYAETEVFLRDALHLFRVVILVTQDARLAPLTAGLHEVLNQIADHPVPSVFSLIHTIEEQPFPQASAAFAAYCTRFQRSGELPPDQAVTVAARFTGRAVDALDARQVGRAVAFFCSVLRAHPHLLQFGAKQLMINISAAGKQRAVLRQLEQLYGADRLNLQQSEQLQSALELTVQNTHVAVRDGSTTWIPNIAEISQKG